MRFQTVKIKQSKSFVKTKDLDCLIQTKEKSFVNSQKKCMSEFKMASHQILKVGTPVVLVHIHFEPLHAFDNFERVRLFHYS